MIRRTVLEWGSIGYGDGAELIPALAADRLAAVARRSPLGGKDGESILLHGRKALHARQVVGVIAADRCALEILPKIDASTDGAMTSGNCAGAWCGCWRSRWT